MVSLHEKLFLLALDEEKGNFIPFTRTTISFGLAGALLAELALLGKICSNEKHRLEFVNADPVGDEILDEVLHEIVSSDKPRRLSFWVSHLKEQPKKIRIKIGECLAAKNLLHQDANRFYRIPVDILTAEPAAPDKFQIKNPLREVISNGSEVDQNSMALLGILGACELLNLVFTADELAIAKRKIHEKVMQAVLKNPSLQTVEEIEYAITTSIEDSSD